MALQDILQAITDEADTRISEAQAAHKKTMKEMKDQHDASLSAALSRIRQHKEQRKRQMRSRAEAQARMVSSHALLNRKRQLLDRLYDGVVEGLAKLPAAKADHLLAACIKRLRGKGTIHPSAAHGSHLKKLAGSAFAMGEPVESAGGFRFVGDTEDHDYTFEFLAHRVLRPDTEIDAARRLFPSTQR